MRSCNTIGNYNTANGAVALAMEHNRHHNTANGSNALWENTTGDYNTANGAHALLATNTAAQTRPPVMMRSQATMPITTPPMVLMRS